jgi:recombination protein RecA
VKTQAAIEPRPVAPRESSPTVATAPPAWTLAAFSGRLGEISGAQATAVLTLAFRLVLETQRNSEPVAWVTRQGNAFYPPDAAAASIDLDSLVVVWTPDTVALARAADRLARSGAFGLVVLDLGNDGRLPPPMLTRLVGLARKHHAAVLFLTEKNREHPSVGSLVSIRVEAARVRREGEHYICEAHVLKDKRRGPGLKHTEICHAPDGLR